MGGAGKAWEHGSANMGRAVGRTRRTGCRDVREIVVVVELGFIREVGLVARRSAKVGGSDSMRMRIEALRIDAEMISRAT